MWFVRQVQCCESFDTIKAKTNQTKNFNTERYSSRKYIVDPMVHMICMRCATAARIYRGFADIFPFAWLILLQYLCCAGKNLECLTIDAWLVINLSLVLGVWCLVLENIVWTSTVTLTLVSMRGNSTCNIDCVDTSVLSGTNNQKLSVMKLKAVGQSKQTEGDLLSDSGGKSRIRIPQGHPRGPADYQISIHNGQG